MNILTMSYPIDIVKQLNIKGPHHDLETNQNGQKTIIHAVPQIIDTACKYT